MFNKLLQTIILSTAVFCLNIQTVSAQNDSPRLIIISPQENEQILGTKVKVNFIINNFIFVNSRLRPKNSLGEGHLHVWLDETNPNSNNAQEVVKASEFALENISAGNHRLILELVSNDHASLKPPINQSVIFTTKAVTNITTVPITVAATNNPASQNMENKKKLQMKSAFLYTATGIFGVLLIVLSGLVLLRRKHF